MGNLLPLGTGIGRIRGIVIVLKQHRGSMLLSELAEEVGENIDELFPLIDACKLLGFATIDESKIKLTAFGAKMTINNSYKMIRTGLNKIEPFKTTIRIIGNQEITTEDLFKEIESKGIKLHGEKETNDMMLKKLLLRWGVRSKLLSYDVDKDTWSLLNEKT